MSDEEYQDSDDEAHTTAHRAEQDPSESHVDEPIENFHVPRDTLTPPENLEQLYKLTIDAVPVCCADIVRGLYLDKIVYITAHRMMPQLSKYYTGTYDEWIHDVSRAIHRWLTANGYNYVKMNDFTYKVMGANSAKSIL